MVKKIEKVPDDFALAYMMGDSIPTSPVQATMPSVPDEQDNTAVADKTVKKTVPAKQRKAGLEEYRETFLSVPKITDRKNVFISNSTRELIVGIVRRLGGEKTSVSGFLENLVLHHFGEYGEDFEAWKKL
ncbi:hypothetical protein AGMMS49574_26940 [Bacteroidia bacterium]|nr:hypothetical protein AGMMS49574_26940 [Bacteroidia bacterium]